MLKLLPVAKSSVLVGFQTFSTCLSTICGFVIGLLLKTLLFRGDNIAMCIRMSSAGRFFNENTGRCSRKTLKQVEQVGNFTGKTFLTSGSEETTF